MAIKEGKWRCPACEAVNAGRDMKCASCGTVRGPNVTFFLDENAAEISDEKLLATAQGGADWHCDFCGTDNRAGVAACRQCGAPREGMKNRETGMVGQVPVQGGAQRPVPGPKGKPMRLPLPAIIAIALVAVAAILGLFLLFRGTETTLRLQGGEWSRTIQIERQELVRHEAWRDQIPLGGHILRTWEAQRSTERVQVGTERVKTGTKDMGNGFFQDVYEQRPIYKDNPIYGTRAEYEILEWKTYRQAAVRGSLGDAPTWPDPGLGPGDREGLRREQSKLRFVSADPKEAGKVFTYEGAKPEELASYVIDRDYPAMVRGETVLSFIKGK